MQRNTMALLANSMSKSRSESLFSDSAAVLREFERAIHLTPSITALLLSTADGRAVADVSNIPVDPRRLAAMTNSFLTLGETMAKELGMAAADHATVRTPDGNMVLIRIDAAQPLTLTSIGRSDATLATLLFATRECAHRIREHLPAPAL